MDIILVCKGKSKTNASSFFFNFNFFNTKIFNHILIYIMIL